MNLSASVVVTPKVMAGARGADDFAADRRSPEGPALALLRIAARHPRILRENLRTAA
jgi:hypothetical protein